jgi:hypothetical protein
MVTGLFTDTKINSQISSASADVGIEVCLQVDGATQGILPTGGCVVYDQRFQQISSGLFSQISNCVPILTGQNCTQNSDCTVIPSGDTVFCDNPNNIPNGGTCEAFPTACNFDLILSTLSAHSFNFIVSVPGGQHTVSAAWKLIGVNTTGNSSVAACVGPGTLTVTQTKVFNNSGSITVQ